MKAGKERFRLLFVLLSRWVPLVLSCGGGAKKTNHLPYQKKVNGAQRPALTKNCPSREIFCSGIIFLSFKWSPADPPAKADND